MSSFKKEWEIRQMEKEGNNYTTVLSPFVLTTTTNYYSNLFGERVF